MEPAANEAIQWEYHVQNAYDTVYDSITRLDSHGNCYLAGARSIEAEEHLVVVKFGADGDEWIAYLDDIQEEPLPSIRVLSVLENGDVLIATSKGHMYRIDAEGQLVWASAFEGADRTSTDANENGFALLHSNGCCQHTLYRYDLDGTLMWFKPVNPGMLSLHSNGEMSIVTMGCIDRLDASGNVTWTRNFEIKGFDWCDEPRISRIGDDGFAYFCLKHLHGTQIEFHAARLSRDGEVLWQKKLNPNKSAYLAAGLPGDSTLLGGMSCTTPERGHDAVLYAFDRDGDYAWERWFGGEGWEAPTAFQVNADGCITVGAARDGDLWVFEFSDSKTTCLMQ